jgi:hypothetical protein
MKIIRTCNKIEVFFDDNDTITEFDAIEFSVRAAFSMLQRIKEVEDQLPKNIFKE